MLGPLITLPFQNSYTSSLLLLLLLLLLLSPPVIFDSLWPHGLQHARLPSLSFAICWNLLKLISIESVSNHWDPTISSSVIPFFCLQYFPASGSFSLSQIFASGGHCIGASALVLSMSIQGWFPLGLTGLIFLQSKGLSRLFPNTTVWKHQSFGIQPS